MTFSIDEYAENIVKPGYGYGSGCEILKRSVRVVDGVEFTCLRVQDPHYVDPESIYLTPEGFVITPMVGSYGSAVRWGMTGRTEETREEIRKITRDHSGVMSLVNLSGAAKIVNAYRARQEA